MAYFFPYNLIINKLSSSWRHRLAAIIISNSCDLPLCWPNHTDLHTIMHTHTRAHTHQYMLTTPSPSSLPHFFQMLYIYTPHTHRSIGSWQRWKSTLDLIYHCWCAEDFSWFLFALIFSSRAAAENVTQQIILISRIEEVHTYAFLS